jgi:hypothetical protein
MRALVRGTQPLRRFEPTASAAMWAAAARRAGRLWHLCFGPPVPARQCAAGA